MVSEVSMRNIWQQQLGTASWLSLQWPTTTEVLGSNPTLEFFLNPVIDIHTFCGTVWVLPFPQPAPLINDLAMCQNDNNTIIMIVNNNLIFTYLPHKNY